LGFKRREDERKGALKERRARREAAAYTQKQIHPFEHRQYTKQYQRVHKAVSESTQSSIREYTKQYHRIHKAISEST
jgi:hypothetical protein